jgi:hypothetical protein
MKFTVGPDHIYFSFYGRFHIKIFYKKSLPLHAVSLTPFTTGTGSLLARREAEISG